MALCIAYLCISSFSASFCKRNIIKIIMKIRFCELSSLGAPVFWVFFMALVVPFELFPLGCRWGLDPAETLGMGMGGSQQSSGGRTHPKPSREAGTGSSAPHPDPRAVPSVLGHPHLQVENLLSIFCTPGVAAELDFTELDFTEPEFCPCPDPTDPPKLLLPSFPQCSVGFSMCARNLKCFFHTRKQNILLVPPSFF